MSCLATLEISLMTVDILKMMIDENVFMWCQIVIGSNSLIHCIFGPNPFKLGPITCVPFSLFLM